MSCFDDGMPILCEWFFFVLFLVLYFRVGLDFSCVAFKADRTILRVFACFEAGYEMGLLQVFIWYLHILLMDVKWILVALICYACIHMDFTGVYGHLFIYFSYIVVCDLLFLDVVIIFLRRFSFYVLMLLDRRSPGYHVFACLLLSN